MAGETYGVIVPPSGASFVAGHAARASQIEQVRQNAVIMGKPRYIDLGGSEIDGHDDSSYARLRSGKVVPLCEEDYRGLTLTLEVWVRVSNAAGTVQVRLRSTDNTVTVAEISAVSVTTTTKETAACTLPAGTTPKDCQLEIVLTSGKIGFAYGHLKLEL
jgi:hypothetical protein